MANKNLENAFFYNSQNGDRIYDADSFEYWLKKFFTTGVFEGDLQVKATTGMGVSVGSGYCNVDGKVKIWDTPTEFTLEVADELYDRIDSIVIQRNDTNREFTIITKTGTPSSQPVAPLLTRENGIYEIQLAQIRLGAGLISLTQANITDTRTNKDLCGYVTSTVENLDFDQLMAQFNSYFENFKSGNEEEFKAWFEKIKGQLSSDAAGNLQNQIYDLDKKIKKVSNDLVSTTKVVTIQPEEWQEGIYTLNDPLVTSDTSNQDWMPKKDISKEELDILLAAIIIDYDQDVGWTKIKCLGDIPAVAVTFRVCFRGDK